MRQDDIEPTFHEQSPRTRLQPIHRPSPGRQNRGFQGGTNHFVTGCCTVCLSCTYQRQSRPSQVDGDSLDPFGGLAWDARPWLAEGFAEEGQRSGLLPPNFFDLVKEHRRTDDVFYSKCADQERLFRILWKVLVVFVLKIPACGRWGGGRRTFASESWSICWKFIFVPLDDPPTGTPRFSSDLGLISRSRILADTDTVTANSINTIRVKRPASRQICARNNLVSCHRDSRMGARVDRIISMFSTKRENFSATEE